MSDRIGPLRPYRLFVKEWIDHRQLDQKRVAERMEIEPGTLSKLIRGKLRWKEHQLAAVAHALDVDVPELFRDPDRPTQADLLRGLSDDRRAEVIRVIQVLTGTG